MFRFLASTNGRLTRVIVGVVLMGLGFWLGSTAGIVLLLVGLVPLATGAFDVCLFAPLAGLPMGGPGIRKALQSP